jgi:hypothetical protein
MPNSRSWNVQLISNVFDNQAVQAITMLQVVPSDEPESSDVLHPKMDNALLKMFTGT